VTFVTKWSCPGSFAVNVIVGGLSLSATVSISSPSPTVTIQADDPTLFLVGQTKDVTALGQNAFASSSTGTYTWTSGDTSILGISPASDHVQISGVSAGSTTLSVSFQNCTGTGTSQIAVQVVAVDIGDIPRVPVSGAVNNEKPISVTITPSPLMSGNTIKVQIQKVSGAGQATFDDGLSVRFLSQSETVRIRGIANSDTKDNLKLTALLVNQEGANKVFTVSTWPTNFRHSLLTDYQQFGFTVRDEWDSESGNLADLGNVVLREEVFYTHPGSNPPFTVAITSNPTHTPNPPAPGTDGLFNDSHTYQPQWVDFTTRHEDYRIGEQEYQFQDTVLQTPWMGLANYTILKEVIDDPAGTYKFRTTKYGSGGFSHSITESP
jgi:hypothetical protein